MESQSRLVVSTLISHTIFTLYTICTNYPNYHRVREARASHPFYAHNRQIFKGYTSQIRYYKHDVYVM